MDQIILYSYFRSSASYRVRIVLHYKEIPFEYRAVHLVKDGGMQLKPEYQKLNPMCQVPLLVDGTFSITQSMAMILYLEEKFPQNPIMPKDLKMRAVAMELSEMINSGIQPLQNISVTAELGTRYNQSKDSQAEWIKFWIEKGMRAFEQKISKTAGKYSLGDNISIVDCFLIPQITSSIRFGVDVSKFPTCLNVYNNCQELAPFQKASPGQQPDSE